MIKHKYLSIDLDFWNTKRTEEHSIKFFKKVAKLNIPMLLVDDHHHLLNDINESGCDYIYNVDYHSDLFGFTGEVDKMNFLQNIRYYLNCGTWGIYVKWANRGTFNWIHPIDSCYNDKNRKGACWGCYNDNPYTGITNWNTVVHSSNLDSIEWDTIRSIGICASSNWTYIKNVATVCEALKIYTTNKQERTFQFCDSGYHDNKFIKRFKPRTIKRIKI